MGGRKRSIRLKIASLLVVPFVSLVAIWWFAATLTVNDGVELMRIRGLYDVVIVPTAALSTAIQEERLESSVYYGSSEKDRTALVQRRAATDAAIDTLERETFIQEAQSRMPRIMRQRLDEMTSRLARLTDIRNRVDTSTFTRSQVIEAYSGITEAAIRLLDTVKVNAGLEYLEQSDALTTMIRVRDLLSRQAALINGAVASGTFTGEEHTAFRGLVENRRLLYSLAFDKFDATLRAPYYTLQNSAAYRQYEAVEDTITAAIRPERPLPRESAEWGRTSKVVYDEFGRINLASSAGLSERLEPIAFGIISRIAGAAGVGLVAVIGSIILMVRLARSIGSELSRLRTAVLELAHRRLPRIVERLRRGENVNVAEEAPDMHTASTEEIADVEAAFAAVQRTAVEAAVGQAEIRKGVNQVFLNLARRNQSLLHRQLSMLEGMERRATEPEVLEDLFALDHLTTRMRRHAEGLIILSGAAPARGWRNPVSVFDVIRAAVEEVEDYQRVEVDIQTAPALVGSAVTDVVHLVAELVENGAMFSPPHTHVHIRGEYVGKGYALEIEDRGLGMSPEEYARINYRLADPPEFDLADSDRLGLFVVGRLAARQGIQVSLRPSPYGGTVAIVLIPAQLVTDEVPELSAPPFRQSITFSAEQVSPLKSVPSPPDTPDTPVTPVTLSTAQPPEQPGELPRRIRQANLAPQLRRPAPAAKRGDTPGSATVLTSFRAGWARAEQEHDS